MITIIGALLGFLSSFAPMLLDYFKFNATKKQEVELLNLKMLAATQGAQINLDLTNELGQMEQMRLAYAQENSPTNIKWVDAVRALVRPSITYIFFFLFLGVKAIGMYRLIDLGVPFVDTVSVIWDEDTAAMFALVVSFWFGNRTVERLK